MYGLWMWETKHDEEEAIVAADTAEITKTHRNTHTHTVIRYILCLIGCYFSHIRHTHISYTQYAEKRESRIRSSIKIKYWLLRI